MGPINNTIKCFLCITVSCGIVITILSILSCFINDAAFEVVKPMMIGCMIGLVIGVLGLGFCVIYNDCVEGNCCCIGTEQSEALLAHEPPTATAKSAIKPVVVVMTTEQAAPADTPQRANRKTCCAIQ